MTCSATRNSRQAAYTANDLNQYEQRTVPGAIDVLGEAHEAAAVTVDSQSAQRTGRDFYREVALANSAGPAYSAVEVQAVFDSQPVDETRHAFLPETPEEFPVKDGTSLRDMDNNRLSGGAPENSPRWRRSE